MNREIESGIYDLEYYIGQEYRFYSGCHSGRIKNILSAVDVKGKKVLDCGCGCGLFSNQFKKMGADVIGVDYSSSAIEMARETFDGDFRVGDILDLEFEDNTFDIVFFIDAIEHIRDYKKALSEIKRVLKTGGILVISTDTENKMPKFMSVWEKLSTGKRAGDLIRKVKVNQRDKKYKSTHINEMNYDELKEAVEGFDIIEHKVYPIVSVPIRDYLLKLLPIKYRGNHQIIVAKKINNL